MIHFILISLSMGLGIGLGYWLASRIPGIRPLIGKQSHDVLLPPPPESYIPRPPAVPTDLFQHINSEF